MKKLMIFCFTILSVILSALSCFNFAFVALDQIEEDKITLMSTSQKKCPMPAFLLT